MKIYGSKGTFVVQLTSVPNQTAQSESEMDENEKNQLSQLTLAMKSLAKAVEKSLLMGLSDGTGTMIARNYRDLHARIAELMPDDYYVSTVLKLEVEPGMDDHQKVAQVQLASSQLIGYLESTMKSPEHADVESIKGLGRELQDQIIVVTRKALRRALSNIDIDIDLRGVPEPPEPPTPPEPPEPLTPPTPPDRPNLIV
jgi:hypothetical protein